MVSTTNNEFALRMVDISKEFSGVRVLRGVDFELRKGEVMALMGENGAGKSTLMKILAGVHTDWEGSLELDGKPARFVSTREAIDAGIGIIYQELNLVPELTIAENIFLGREPAKFWGRGAAAILDFSRMNSLARIAMQQLDCDIPVTMPVGQLRVGNQQLVEIAKALSAEAQILVMDEPTSALSEAEAEILFAVIRRLQSQGVSIIYISHRMAEVFELADRITVLRDGELVDVVDADQVDRQELVRMMIGRQLDQYFVRDTLGDRKDVSVKRHVAEPVLRICNLTRHRPGANASAKPMIANVSLDVHAGEIVGLAGLLGAGRTELLEAVIGVDSVWRTGDLFVDGQIKRIDNPRMAIEAGIAMITEDRKGNGLVLGMSVEHNLTLASLKSLLRFGLLSRKKERALAEESVRKMKIDVPKVSSRVDTLSGGNQQKVLLAKWLCTHPKVLLLDEPTRGIDIGAKHEIYELLCTLAKEGMAIVLASSELSELLSLCDRILVLREGEISAEFQQAEATQENILTAAAPLGNNSCERF